MNKTEVIDTLTKTRDTLIRILHSIPADRWDEVFLGKWSLKDITAHLTGWDIENSKSVDEMLRGDLPSCFIHWDENWKSYNDVLVRRYRINSKIKMLKKLEVTFRTYHQKLLSVPDLQFDTDIGLRWHGYIITPGVNADYEAKDELNHINQITNWLLKKPV